MDLAGAFKEGKDWEANRARYFMVHVRTRGCRRAQSQILREPAEIRKRIHWRCMEEWRRKTASQRTKPPRMSRSGQLQWEERLRKQPTVRQQHTPISLSCTLEK